MKRAVFFAVFALSILPLSAKLALAQNAPSGKPSSLYGMTENEVGSRYGKPDTVRTKESGNTEWIYGDSTVFFLGGKVSAWSDAGELGQRERLNAVQSDKIQRDDSLSDQWVNPWTPPGRAAPSADGLKEVLED